MKLKNIKELLTIMIWIIEYYENHYQNIIKFNKPMITYDIEKLKTLSKFIKEILEVCSLS